MKYVIVKPTGGLANRLRVIEASYNYALSQSAKFTILWEKNSILNAAYSECFMPVKHGNIINMDYNGTNTLAKLKRTVFNAAQSVCIAFFCTKKITDSDIEPLLNFRQSTDELKAFFDRLVLRYKVVFIESCYEFYPNLLRFHLRIQTEIQLTAYRLIEKCPPLIGLHIRRTDNYDAIVRSPLTKFIEEINANLTVSPSAVFYLSTDSEEVVHELKKLFPEKIITGITVRTRSSKEGIVSALTDLCCLSQCRRILGSYKSSFSERAAVIGNIPLQIVTV